MIYDSVREYLSLSAAEVAFLNKIEQQIGIAADLSRADILMYSRRSEKESIILAHAQPHSLAHVYSRNRRGSVINASFRPEVLTALTSGTFQPAHRSTISEGAPVAREAMPIYYPPPFPHIFNGNETHKPRVIAAMVIVTNLIEFERHRLRSAIFRRALRRLYRMVLYGQVEGAENLTPFGEQDGITFVDQNGIIRYTSGIAANIYRRIGYKDTIVGRHVSEIDTLDDDIRREALHLNRALQTEGAEGDRYLTRKAIPLMRYPRLEWLTKFGFNTQEQPYGVILTLHDDTANRQQDEELRIKNAMIQEVHHRVKNNLQTIAGLLRMQIRRVESDEARTVLDETLGRILSIAVIHEFLSYENTNIINIKDISNRIASQMQSVIDPNKQIRFKVVGQPVYLPARQATASSLIINELLQNAIEHGFTDRDRGTVQINLEDGGEDVIITVADDGEGMPEGYDMSQSKSLGLQIIKILVEGDLKGRIEFSNNAAEDQGLAITISFPKVGFEGEEGWKEHVSS